MIQVASFAPSREHAGNRARRARGFAWVPAVADEDCASAKSKHNQPRRRAASSRKTSMNTIEKVIVGIGIAVGGMIGYKIGAWELGNLKDQLQTIEQTAKTADAEAQKSAQRIAVIQTESAQAVKAREAEMRQGFEAERKSLKDSIAQGQQRIAALDLKANKGKATLEKIQEEMKTATGQRLVDLQKREQIVEQGVQKIQAKVEAIACEAKAVPDDLLARLNALISAAH
jgi:DNA anti-recombination protein RmuC